MKILLFCITSYFVLISCNKNTSKPTEVVQVNTVEFNKKCEDQDAPVECYFENMPTSLGNEIIIASSDEKGEKMIIEGQVFDKNRNPYPNVLLYFYHTNHAGIYTTKGNEKGVQKFHGYLHGWCKTNEEGKYILKSIRPSPYPNSNIPAHIHIAVKEPSNNPPFFINDFVFKDDEFVNETYKASLKKFNFKGGDGIIDLQKNKEGIWIGKGNIFLE
jgi:protocatechuate 3,4-dioxygenase beta subunit